MTNSQNVSKSAVLDTNALIRVFDFWSICRAISVPLNNISNWTTLHSLLVRNSRSNAIFNDFKVSDVDQGLKCFNSMKTNSVSYQFYTSSICRSEMNHILLDQLANTRLIRRRIPYRMRVKRPQMLYRKALERRDYRKTKSDMAEFFESLRVDYNVDIIEIEQSSVPFADILHTAEEIWSRILIDVMDSYIYASAVEIDADVFLTSDVLLINALSNLHRPTGDWVSLVTSLKRTLGKSGVPEPRRPQNSLP